MPSVVKEYTSDFFNLFYPEVCLACSQKLLKGEQLVCFKCGAEMPRTDQWKTPNNALMKRFWGRVDIQGAAAFYYFQKDGVVQHLLHQLKYNGRQEVGEFIGKELGDCFTSTGSVVKDIDLVVPVPLHWKKLKKRGYNQCAALAHSLAEAMNVAFSETTLERVHENVSQTTINRFDRHGNVNNIFAAADPAQLTGKHILLVDDVVTTGATAEVCLQTILSVPGTRVSFAAIA